MDIISLGEILIDMFPAEQGRSLVEVSAFHPKPGGAPANVAVAAQRLGTQTAFIGKVGDDFFGHYLIDVLKGEGVETKAMRVDEEARTTMAFIAMPDANTHEFVFYRNPGADTRLSAAELDQGLLAATNAFHFGSLSLTDEPAREATLQAIQIARQGGALISYDVNYRPALWGSPDDALAQAKAMLSHVDLLKVNEIELELLSGKKGVKNDHAAISEACQVLLSLGPQVIIVTLGPNGGFFQVAAGGEHVPGFKVETIDAIGCGDAFIAGLLTQLVRDGKWQDKLTPDQLGQMMRYANAVGALTSLTQGVIPALPTADQVDEFLKNRSA